MLAFSFLPKEKITAFLWSDFKAKLVLAQKKALQLERFFMIL